MARSLTILTGSNGFIGRNFKSKLKNIIELDQHNCWEFFRTFDQWKEVDLIIHQGAISSTVETDITKIHQYNVEYTLKLFSYAMRYDIPVKYASSASVYGNTRGQINPLNYYAISKLQIDYFVQDNLEKFSSIQGFRYFNVYGKYEDNKGDQASPVSKFTKQIKETGKLKLFEGSDKFFRDFICVDDLVNVVLNNENPSGIYDLGTSNPVSFQHVAECVARKYNGEIEYISFPDHLKGKYQDYTCAKNEWKDYQFKTVEEYLT
jgi:ADP-L-glycero-D-manno-heptose 6-epimerase